MKNSRSRHFSMLEVLLAIVVVGVGLAVLMLLFPVAARTANDTIDNNYVPMVASSFITYTLSSVDADKIKYSKIQNASSNNKPIEAIPDLDKIETKCKKLGSVSADAEPISFYSYPASAQYPEGFCVVIKGCDASGKYTVVDFAAAAKLEKATAANLDGILYYNNDVYSSNSNSQVDALGSSTFTDKFARFILTVSWPLEVPPAARKSRVFIIEKARLL